MVGELREQGYLDDESYARRFAEDRRRLDDWGAERIERKLHVARRGPRPRRRRRSASRTTTDELGAALELLARRFPQPPETLRDRDRALGMLVRKGYGLELAHDALRRHAGVARRASGLTVRLARFARASLAVLRSSASDRPGRERP